MIDCEAVIQIAETRKPIPTILRSLPDEKVQEMQCNCLFIYRNYFMRPGGSLEIARVPQKRIVDHPNYEGSEEIHSVLREWPSEEVMVFPRLRRWGFVRVCILWERYNKKELIIFEFMGVLYNI